MNYSSNRQAGTEIVNVHVTSSAKYIAKSRMPDREWVPMLTVSNKKKKIPAGQAEAEHLRGGRKMNSDIYQMFQTVTKCLKYL